MDQVPSAALSSPTLSVLAMASLSLGSHTAWHPSPLVLGVWTALLGMLINEDLLEDLDLIVPFLASVPQI